MNQDTKTPRKTGIELIAEERARQIQQEGWAAEHDDQHVGGEMAHAAVGYAALAAYQSSCIRLEVDKIRNLVKAGALIAAEIDRLQRKDSQPSPPSPLRGTPKE